MNDVVNDNRRSWNDAIRLAAVISIIAAVAAIIASVVGDVPQAAIVLPVIVLAFVASWVQTGRAPRHTTPVKLATPASMRLRSGSLHHG